MPLNLMDLLAHGLNNIYYHFDSAANLESKDFFSVFFFDYEVDGNLHKVDR